MLPTDATDFLPDPIEVPQKFKLSSEELEIKGEDIREIEGRLTSQSVTNPEYMAEAWQELNKKRQEMFEDYWSREDRIKENIKTFNRS